MTCVYCYVNIFEHTERRLPVDCDIWMYCIRRLAATRAFVCIGQPTESISRNVIFMVLYQIQTNIIRNQ